MTDPETTRAYFKDGKFCVRSGARVDEHDGQVVMAALLLTVARGDGEIAPSETDTMIDLLSRRFGIGAGLAFERLRQALHSLSAGNGFSPLLRNAASRMSRREKREIVIMMLEVANADGIKRPDELDAINRITELIQMSPADVHKAYQCYFARTDN